MKQILIISILFPIFSIRLSLGQISETAAIEINAYMPDTFSFVNKWDYPWHVIKNDDGSFEKTLEGELTANDTLHLFYTANCTTNVQGGYNIRYCYAEMEGDTIVLTFSDGLPAYASEFIVRIHNDHFSFFPGIIYPVLNRNEKRSYMFFSNLLVLNRGSYQINDVITGFINTIFTETCILPNKEKHESVFYLKGFFRTTLRNDK